MEIVEKFNTLFRRELTTVQVYAQLLRNEPQLLDFANLVAAMHGHQAKADRIAGEIRQLKGNTTWLAEVPAEVSLEELAVQEELTSAMYREMLHDSDFSVQLLVQELHNPADSAVDKVKEAA